MGGAKESFLRREATGQGKSQEFPPFPFRGRDVSLREVYPAVGRKWSGGGGTEVSPGAAEGAGRPGKKPGWGVFR